MQEWEERDWQRTCKISLVFDMHASADTHKHTLPYVALRGPSLTRREAIKKAVTNGLDD